MREPPKNFTGYRGRVAPTPTGLLHAGHARTFWTAHERARAAGGGLIYRNEDLDRARCRDEYSRAAIGDLRWLGIDWTEGPDRAGPVGPYTQSERWEIYREAFGLLKMLGTVYPCYCSRQDILRAMRAPHLDEENAGDEPLYSGACRPGSGPGHVQKAVGDRPACWRFQVPDGERIEFHDIGFGPQCFVAGKDFGDFIVWTRADWPAYQLAVVVDDALMGITEVVRGADLLLSTARQILLYRALGWRVPAFYHCPLVTDAEGRRLAKRHDALSIRSLRENGASPEQVRVG